MLAGVKPENIIYMTYYSDVYSDRNPFKGMVFTDPAETTDGDWAKYGCFDHVDYTDDDLTPEVFLAILSGDAAKVTELTGKENPKVLAATEEDTVFTFFIDHGNEGIIVVGNDDVTDKQLIETLKTAHEKKIYGKWVWFMEACHSGSMFRDLPADWNIFAMTASDADHNAKMANCPPKDVVAGVALGTCIGSLWDQAYLEYAEQNPKTIIGDLVDAVKVEVAKTSDQNVSQYGDMTFRDMPFADFFGEVPPRRNNNNVNNVDGLVPLSEVPLHLAKWRAIRAHDDNMETAMEELKKEVAASAKREVEVMRLGSAILGEKATDKAMKTMKTSSYSASCVRNLSLSLVEKCGHSLPFSESSMSILRNICYPGKTMSSVNWSDICM